MDLRYRNTESEFMDNPNVTVDTLRMVFKDINKSNRFLGGNSITLGKVSKLIKEFPNSPGYRLILNNILFPAAKKPPQKT